MQSLILIVFFLALLVSEVLGTETRSLLFWPGAVLLGVTGLLTTLKWRLRVRFAPSDLCLTSVLIFVAYIAYRAATSPVIAFAREDLVILAGCVIAYVLTATAASDTKWRTGLMALLIVLAMGNLLVGAIHLAGNWGFHLIPDFQRAADQGRIGGFFPNPNHLAAFLSFVLFITAGWLFFGRGNATLKLLLGFMAISMAIGMTLTLSRGALIGLAAGIATLGLLTLALIYQTQRHLFWRFLVGGSAIILLGAATLWEVNEEYLRGRMDRSPATEDVRFGIWEAALTQHSQSPLMGAGARMFYDGSIQYRSPKLPVYSAEALFAHNEYLQMLADYGGIGLGLIILVIVAHTYNALAYLHWFTKSRFLRIGRLTSTKLALCIGSLAALVATLVHAIFEFHLHVPATALVTAIVLSILANPGIESRSHAPCRVPGIRLLTKLSVLFASISLLAGAWMFGLGDYYLALSQIDRARHNAFIQIQHLNQAIEADPTNVASFYQRGLTRLNQLNTRQITSPNHPVLKRAVDDLEKAIELNPHSYLYHVVLADAYDAQGRAKDALKAIKEALRLAPLHEEPRLALGIHWHRWLKFEKAELAYLWAGQARAWNESGTSRWIDNYRQLLRDAAFLRDRQRQSVAQPPKKPD